MGSQAPGDNAVIDQILNEVGHWLWAHTIGLIDPWVGWLIEGILIIMACTAAAWFFSILRPIAGAIVLATITFLVGFWKGENRDR